MKRCIDGAMFAMVAIAAIRSIDKGHASAVASGVETDSFAAWLVRNFAAMFDAVYDRLMVSGDMLKIARGRAMPPTRRRSPLRVARVVR